MNDERQLQTVANEPDARDWQAAMNRARAELAEAEAELAQEQAAVNAFRMHARLKLDDLVDQLLELRTEKESLLVRLEFLHQGLDWEQFLDDDDPLKDTEWPQDLADDEPLIPTPTPRDKAAEKRLYRELARRFHPDMATSAFERSYRTTMMAAVNVAYSSGDYDALYDLAGELSPGEAHILEQIADARTRSAMESIEKMHMQKRRANRQLMTLRQENTARLWHQAETLEEGDEDGWSMIRRTLQDAIERQAYAISVFRLQIEDLERTIEEK